MLTADKIPYNMQDILRTPLISGAGAQVLDVSRNHLHGAMVGPLNPFRKKVGCAGVLFDASLPVRVDCTNDAAYDFGTAGTSFTILAKVKVRTLVGANRMIFYRQDAAGNGYQVQLTATGRILFRTSQGGANQDSQTGFIMAAGDDVIVGVSYTIGAPGAGVARFYRDIVAIASAVGHTDPAAAVGEPAYIGDDRVVNNAPFDGEMEWVRVWNVVLGDEEVVSVAEGDRTIQAAALVGWWDLTRGWGDQAYDRTATASHGTIQNNGVADTTRWQMTGSELQALDFWRHSSQVNFGTDVALQMGPNSMSVAFWLKLHYLMGTNTLFANQPVFDKGLEDTDGYECHFDEFGILRFSSSDGAGHDTFAIGEDAAVQEQWAHFALVRPNNVDLGRAYKNGRDLSISFDALRDPVPNAARPLYLGRDTAATHRMDGELALFHMSRSAWSAAEVRGVFSRGRDWFV